MNDKKIGVFIECIEMPYFSFILSTDVMDVFSGIPVYIRSETDKYNVLFYGTITSSIGVRRDRLSETIAGMETPKGNELMVSYEDAEYPVKEHRQYEAVMKCERVIYLDKKGESDPIFIHCRTIPPVLSDVYMADKEIVDLVYKASYSESFANIGKLGNRRFYEIHGIEQFDFGIDVKKLSRLSFGVFAKTGSGKTVLLKNILTAIIKDFNISNRRAIIFDVHNEYTRTTQSRSPREPGLYDVLQDKIKVITLYPEDIKKLGLNRTEYIPFRIFKKNITVEDVLSALEDTNLTEKMEDMLRKINSRYIRGKINYERKLEEEYNNSDELKQQYITFDAYKKDHPYERTFYDELVYFYNPPDEKELVGQLYGSSAGSFASYDALCWRLRRFMPESDKNPTEGEIARFITSKNDPGDHDIVDMLLSDLRSTSLEKYSYIIHFGEYSKDRLIYNFVATFISRILFSLYMDKYKYNLYDPVVIVLEEAHRFLKEGSMFDTIVAEGRKFGISLFCVDQRPSKISENIIANLNNIAVLRMSDPKDIAASLYNISGTREWSSIVPNLENGEALLYGNALQNLPVLITSYYTKSVNEWRKLHGIKTSPTDEAIGKMDVKTYQSKLGINNDAKISDIITQTEDTDTDEIDNFL